MLLFELDLFLFDKLKDWLTSFLVRLLTLLKLLEELVGLDLSIPVVRVYCHPLFWLFGRILGARLIPIAAVLYQASQHTRKRIRESKQRHVMI